MNILHVYKSYYPETQGGVERVIQMLTTKTSALGHQNRLVTCTSEQKMRVSQEAALDIYYYPQTIEIASSPFSYALWKNFHQHVAWADVIHYHFPWPMADLLQVTHWHKKPCMVTYHSDVVRQKYLRYLYQPLMHLFLKQMDCIVPTSDNYVKTSPVLQRYTHKIRVIPIGLDAQHYNVDSEKVSYWRNKLPKPFIAFVGVLRYYKGLEYLLAALDGLPITLVIVGGGPLLEALKQQAASLKQAQIIFTDRLDDSNLCAIYSLATLLVIPASHRSEAYCIALVEGLLFGLPLISTELGTGTSFVNAHKETGLVVSPRDPMALREAIEQLLLDDALMANMRLASRQRFDDYFTVDRMAEGYKNIYEAIILR